MTRLRRGLAAAVFSLASLVAVASFTPAGASTSAYCHALAVAPSPAMPIAPKGALTVTYVARMVRVMGVYMKDVTGFVRVAPSPAARRVFESVLSSGKSFITGLTRVYVDLLYLQDNRGDTAIAAKARSDYARATPSYDQFRTDITRASALSVKLCP